MGSLIAWSSIAHGQEEAPTTTSGEVGATSSLPESVSPQVEETTQLVNTPEERTLQEGVQNRFINLVRNVYGKMDTAITRLDNIAVRLQQRIDVLGNTGVDTAQARLSLDEARAKLTEARTILTTAKTGAEDALLSDTPRDRFLSARDAFKNARTLIREAFLALRASLALLKDAADAHTMNSQNIETTTESTQGN